MKVILPLLVAVTHHGPMKEALVKEKLCSAVEHSTAREAIEEALSSSMPELDRVSLTVLLLEIDNSAPCPDCGRETLLGCLSCSTVCV